MYRVSYPVVFLSAAIAGLIPGISNADLILDFSPDGSVTSFSVLTGDTVEVPVYLRQLSVGAPSPDLTSDGLIDFGLTATLSGGSATFASATAHFDFDFADFSAVNSPDSAELVGAATFGVTGSAIELGSFTITGDAVAGSTTLTLSDTNPGGLIQDFLTESLSANFDSDVFLPVASTTINTTAAAAVPEPGSFIPVTMALALCGACYIRKRRLQM